MLNFFVLNGDMKVQCSATDVQAAQQIIKLMFPNHKAYVVDDNKITFAQNMPIDEARVMAGLPEVIVAPAPKPKAIPPLLSQWFDSSKKKPVAKKSTVKKTKVKSKVAVKSKKPATKTKVKSKVKPKAKKRSKK